MAELLPDDVRAQLRERLAELEAPVRLVHFTHKHASGGCAQQRELLEAVAALSDKLNLEIYELVDDAQVAERFAVDKVPAPTSSPRATSPTSARGRSSSPPEPAPRRPSPPAPTWPPRSPERQEQARAASSDARRECA